MHPGLQNIRFRLTRRPGSSLIGIVASMRLRGISSFDVQSRTKDFQPASHYDNEVIAAPYGRKYLVIYLARRGGRWMIGWISSEGGRTKPAFSPLA